ncbi:unnamed protein product [Caenorhabditis angaria]|uniref:Uncharacterized protein n=1 Tax=Caenorhabditis angaria TaxID=860376 RepID=A0A9P1IVJ3_9PELO|nr:unnamed protein product [Caenorhabditis angaria]
MVTEGYDEAIRRIGGMSESLAAVKRDWDEMHGKNEMIRNTIVQIESQLKDGKLDTKMISDEMELCQERMDNLETMCNFLTDSLVSLKQDNRSENLPDFKKDLSIYSIALKTLKDRLGEIDRIPTPPLMPETISTQTSDEISDQTSTENMEVSQVVQETIGSSRTIKILFALSFIFALAAICYYHIFSKHFGPHLEYVKGPPPF